MKKYFSLFLFTLSLHTAFTCDVCGCSAGNYFIGAYPQFSKGFFGFRYSFRTYHSVMEDDASQFSDDFYQTIEAWGAWKISDKWNLNFFMPYNINRSSSDDGAMENMGWGDLTLIGNYKYFDKTSLTKDTLTRRNQLWIGGGLKVPVGKYALDTAELGPSANSQPATGSFDYIVNATWAFEINNFGVNTNTNYKINGTAEDFKFGNRFSISSFAFRACSVKKLQLSPNAGLLFENLEQNKFEGDLIKDTGGYTLFFAAGAEMVFKKMAFGLNAQAPLTQNLSAGQTSAKPVGWCICLTYFSFYALVSAISTQQAQGYFIYSLKNKSSISNIPPNGASLFIKLFY